MALVFRAAFLGRGLRICATKCNTFKIGLESLSLAQNEYGCKALFTLSTVTRRDYSVVSKAQRKTNVDRDEFDEEFVIKKTPDGKDIVQQGFLAVRIRNLKFFSLTTSFLAISVQPMIYMKAVMGGTASAWTVPAFAVFAAFAVSTPLLLHYVTKRYVTKVIYDPVKDTYTATYYNILVRERKIEFTPEDVTIPTILGMFTTCAIKGRPVFLDSADFPDQRHYVRIMGYDKPLDLGVDAADIKKAKSKKKKKPIDV